MTEHAMVRTAIGETKLDEQQELIIRVREKLTAITGQSAPALDIAARLEKAILDTLDASGMKPRDVQHFYSVAMNQFLVDPVVTVPEE